MVLTWPVPDNSVLAFSKSLQTNRLLCSNNLCPELTPVTDIMKRRAAIYLSDRLPHPETVRQNDDISVWPQILHLSLKNRF